MKQAKLPMAAAIAFLLAACCLSANAGPALTENVRQSLQAAYDLRNAAIGRRDVHAAMACYGDQFLYISPQGRASDKLASRNLIVALFEEYPSLQAATTIKTLTVQKGRAMALCEQAVRVTHAPDRSNPRCHARIVRDITRDVWVRGSGGWQLIRSQTLQRTEEQEPSSGSGGPIAIFGHH